MQDLLSSAIDPLYLAIILWMDALEKNKLLLSNSNSAYQKAFVNVGLQSYKTKCSTP